MNKLAINGGKPFVTEKLPHYVWPNLTEKEASIVYDYLRANKSLSIFGDEGIIHDFEKKLSSYYGTKYSLLVNSGTAALHSAFFALDLKKDDEVIAPTNTFRATVTPLIQFGITPVLCDSDYENGNISLEEIESKITSKTKAIVVTHLWGNPAKIKEICKLAKEKNIKVVEDCSQAYGASYDNKKVGCWGDIACFSMQANKQVFGGEAGFLLTNNQELFERSILLGHSGSKAKKKIVSKKYKQFAGTGYGLKYRIHPLAALISNTQFDNLDKRLKITESNMSFFKRKAEKFCFLDFDEQYQKTEQRAYYSLVAKYVIGLNKKISRDKLVEIMLAENIDNQNDHCENTPLHMQKFYQIKKDNVFSNRQKNKIYKDSDFFVTNRYFESELHFPCFYTPAKKLLDEYVGALEKIEQICFI